MVHPAGSYLVVGSITAKSIVTRVSVDHAQRHVENLGNYGSCSIIKIILITHSNLFPKACPTTILAPCLAMLLRVAPKPTHARILLPLPANAADSNRLFAVAAPLLTPLLLIQAQNAPTNVELQNVMLDWLRHSALIRTRVLLGQAQHSVDMEVW